MSKRTKSVPTSQVQAPTTEQLFQAPEQGAAAVQVTTTEQPPVQEPSVPASVQADQTAAEAPAPAEQSPVQDQEPAAPQSPALSQEPSTPEQAAAATAAAQKAAEEAEEQARTAALATLKAAGKAYWKGEKAYRDGLFEAGRLCSVYVEQRLALGDKRDAATDTLRLELQQRASGKVDVNELLGCYHAHRLLCLEPGVKADVPYGHYKNAWRNLVQRANPGKAEESWQLLPGIEAKAREAFAKAVSAGLSREACEEQAKTLQREYADAEKARTQAAADRAAAEAAALKQQRADQAKRTAAAEEEDRKAQLAAKAAQDTADAEKREQTTRQAEEARERLLAAQREQQRIIAEQEVVSREKARKDRQAKEAKEAADKAAAQEQKAAGKTADKAERKASKARNLLPAGTSEKATDATPEQWGKDAYEFLLQHPEPESALQHLLTLAKSGGEMSRTMVRALESALLLIDRANRPEPKPATAAPLLPTPGTNGHLVGAA